MMLYANDRGGKLDARFQGVRVHYNVADNAKRPDGSLMYTYNKESKYPYTPRRFDAAGKELFLPHQITNDPLVMIMPRGSGWNTPYNVPTDTGVILPNGTRLDQVNALFNWQTLRMRQAVFLQPTPSQVYF